MKNVLLAFDGSSESYEAAKRCWTLVKNSKIKLTAQYVSNTKGLWQFLDFHTPGLTGSGPYVAAQEAMSKQLRALGETLGMAYNAKAQAHGVDLECLIDEGDPVTEILKRADANDLIVIGLHTPPIDLESDSGYNPNCFAPTSLVEILSQYSPKPLLVIQECPPAWETIDLQLDCNFTMIQAENISLWTAALASSLNLSLQIHGYVLGKQNPNGPTLSRKFSDELVKRVRSSYPTIKTTAGKARFWPDSKSGSFAKVACDRNSLIVVPTADFGTLRKTVFGGAPYSFMCLSGRHSLLFVPLESVGSGSELMKGTVATR